MDIYAACKGIAGKEIICWPDPGWNARLEDGEIKAWTVSGVAQPSAQDLTDWWTANGLTQIKNRKKVMVKKEAYRRITTAGLLGETGPFLDIPEWKQRNYSARASELIEIKADGGTLTPEQSAELEAIRGVWDDVKDVRNRSNNIETDVDAAADESAVDAINVKTSARWTE